MTWCKRHCCHYSWQAPAVGNWLLLHQFRAGGSYPHPLPNNSSYSSLSAAVAGLLAAFGNQLKEERLIICEGEWHAWQSIWIGLILSSSLQHPPVVADEGVQRVVWAQIQTCSSWNAKNRIWCSTGITNNSIAAFAFGGKLFLFWHVCVNYLGR